MVGGGLPPRLGYALLSLAAFLCLIDGLLGWSLAGVLVGLVFGLWR